MKSNILNDFLTKVLICNYILQLSIYNNRQQTSLITLSRRKKVVGITAIIYV